MKIDQVFSKEGLLGKALPSFEERKEQQEMARLAMQAYDQDHILLVEAGTGTGKSLAYLFSAIYHAIKHKTKTVIATKTIALQEQLLYKDIPFLLKVLGAQMKVSLVKGMGNYICLRKLQEHLDQLLFAPSYEVQEMMRMEQEGKESFSELSFAVSAAVKEKVAAESHSCNHVHCPFYKECGFFKARKQALDSSLLVVNHHLLLADMKRKQEAPEQESILPSFDRLVVDEAHHFEQVALDSLAVRWQRMEILRALSKLHAEGHGDKSRLHLLKQTLAAHTAIPPSLEQKLDIDIPAYRKSCQMALDAFCLVVKEMLGTTSSSVNGKVRITSAILSLPYWEEVRRLAYLLIDAFKQLSFLMTGLFQDLTPFKDLPFFSLLTAHIAELSSISELFQQGATLLETFIQQEIDPDRVRWIEWTSKDIILVQGQLDISQLLCDQLFVKLKTALLCSATLATGTSFDPLKKRLGLNELDVPMQELIVASPFDYVNRTLFATPLDFPLPSSPTFFASAIEMIKEIVAISQGSALVLFTSYDMLKKAYEELSSLPYPLLKQGEMPRHALLEKFRKQEGSVLLATDSFWEGVDVQGEALRCVVIVKLPFSVPSDPLHEAYSEALEKSGKDPFFDYAVPQAIIKFKQGFGRLMRHKTDRGCVICLDPRIKTKGYGQQFISSLPPCKTYFGNRLSLLDEMRKFYRSTL